LAGGAHGVKGLNAVDSAENTTLVPPPGGLPTKDVEPPDQGLCAGNGYVVETNNIGEILAFNTALQRQSVPINLDTIMGLTSRDWSSGGDPSCVYDSANGGHWFITEIVSASSEANGGPFTGCFVSGPDAVANSCYEGIAVSDGPNPLGGYHVYYFNANYNPNEPGYPYLLNDYAKIAVTRDAFLMFYDEFPLGPKPGLGGGGFNGAQELAFNKTALETGQPVTNKNGKPNRNFSVAIENMGLLATPDGTCTATHGADCWYQVIPAQPADAGQFDNSNGGSGFMLGSLDFVGQGDTRVAAFDWTGLSNLNSNNCNTCSAIRFGGDVFSGVEPYYGEGFLGVQKAGPIPLGDECGAAQLSVPPASGGPPPASCPEGGIATNGDGMTQAAQAQGQLWGAISTEVSQTFGSGSPEVHQGAAYWVIGTNSFDQGGQLSLTNQAYVSAAHEDLEFPTMVAEGTGGNGGAIMSMTVNGTSRYPSSAYGRLTSTSGGLNGSVIRIADAGRSPNDGLAEYAGYPGPTRPRWGDYGGAVYLPGGSQRLYFASEYIQYPSCTKGFTLTVPTCGGTRDGYANWGTSVNYVVP
jgi:hypothetical protein